MALNPILTLTVATGLGPEARSLFRKQDDFNDSALSLEQICPGWVPGRENKMRCNLSRWKKTSGNMQCEKGTKVKVMGKSPGVGYRQQGNGVCYSLKRGFPESPRSTVRSEEKLSFPQDGPAQA